MKRGEEITKAYLSFLDKHLLDIASGNVNEMMKLKEIADHLHITPNHLSDTVQATRGNHPCYFYDQKIIEQAKLLLTTTNLSISEIAILLTYDPSNFNKFFKKITGQTPGEFRTEYKS